MTLRRRRLIEKLLPRFDVGGDCGEVFFKERDKQETVLEGKKRNEIRRLYLVRRGRAVGHDDRLELLLGRLLERFGLHKEVLDRETLLEMRLDKLDIDVLPEPVGFHGLGLDARGKLAEESNRLLRRGADLARQLVEAVALIVMLELLLHGVKVRYEACVYM